MVAQTLQKKGMSVGIVPEMIRTLKVKNNEDTSLNAQYAVLYNQIAHEYEAEANRHDVILCDRSILDNYAYLYHNNNQHHDQVWTMVKKHLLTYDLLILCLADERITIKDDHYRSLDREFQRAIELHTRHLLRNLKRKPIVHNAYSVKEATQKALEALS
jgi:nicotinamide riboside kinase